MGQWCNEMCTTHSLKPTLFFYNFVFAPPCHKLVPNTTPPKPTARHGILERLLQGDEAELPDYTLRFVGHSLGAGIAVLLSLMMRRRYPTLKCLCFSPPGGFLTWKLATECSEFVTSFVLDSDIIPRLSFENMER